MPAALSNPNPDPAAAGTPLHMHNSQNRSFDSSTPPSHSHFCFQPQPAISQNPNNSHGARLMTLLNPPSRISPIRPTSPSIPSQLQLPPQNVNANANAPLPSHQGPVVPMPTTKFPIGRRLMGDRLVYDIDVRLPGEVQPQLEVSPITKYTSDPRLVLGRQIAVNDSYVCYGLKIGAIRVLNLQNCHTSLLKGHAQKVTDMAFFAEDVQLLASASVGGQVYVWKISEEPDEENKSQIIGSIVIAIQITGDVQPARPRVYWHCHKQEILVVGIGRHVLKIDTTKVGKNEKFSAKEPLECPIEKLISGVQFVGNHNGEVTSLSMCLWMTTRLLSASVDGTIKLWEDGKSQPIAVLWPHNGHPIWHASFLAAPHRPDHIILITGGPLNREVKIWVSSSEEGWLLPSDAKSWRYIQSLEFKSSEAHMEDAFFNQITTLPQAGLLLFANAKKNAIYVVHLGYGPNPISTRMDYIAEFSVAMPILSFTGSTSGLLSNSEQIAKVYCVQTQAIQEYTLKLLQCLPPPLENIMYDKSESSASLDGAIGEQLDDMDLTRSKQVEKFVTRSKLNSPVRGSDLSTMSYPVSDASTSVIADEFTSCVTAPLSEVVNDSYFSSVPLPPLPLSPRLSKTLSSFRSSFSSVEHGSPICGPGSKPKIVDHSIDRQNDAIHRDLSDAASFNHDSRKDDTKLSQDDSMMINHETKFKNPTHLATPAEILIANSDVSDGNEPNGDVELKIHDVEISNDARNVNVEEKVVDETKFIHDDDILPRMESSFFCQAPGLGFNKTCECHILSHETSLGDTSQSNASGETRTISRKPTAEEVPESVMDAPRKAIDSSTAIPAQQPASNTRGKKQKGKSAQGSPTALGNASNSIDTSGQPWASSDMLVHSAFAPHIFSMQETLNQLVTVQKEIQKQMSDMITVPLTKEIKRLEATLGYNTEKVIKANADALWASFQEQNAKQENATWVRMQQLTNMIRNCLNKELPSIIEKAVNREIMALGQSVSRAITPAIEKTISTSITEGFQKGVGDKSINQLEKSVSSKLEVAVARQIQAQFQTTGKQALQETLRSSLESSVIPAFEISCRSMFEQVDATFKKGMVEHTSAAQQQSKASHTPLAVALQDAINSASSVAQTLSTEILDGQRKLLALAATGANSKATNSLISQLSNGLLGSLQEKLDEVPVDPTKELSRLIAERKYEEAFTTALQRSDVSMVSWLCSQVDLPGILSSNPVPLSQGVLLSLLQQLACDINKETPRKLTWMRDILSVTNPTDPMIVMHVRCIFEQVYQILNHHCSLPTTTTVEQSSIRLIIHVINSMLMTTK